MATSIGKTIFDTATYNVYTWDDVILNLRDDWEDIFNEALKHLTDKQRKDLDDYYRGNFPKDLLDDIKNEAAGDLIFSSDASDSAIRGLAEIFSEITNEAVF